jgi:hypothetical protein
MRISGFMAGPAPGGTLALILFTGLASGLFGGIVYAVVEPWLRRWRPWHGLAFGVGLFLALGLLVLDPFNFDFRRFGVAARVTDALASLAIAPAVLTAA